MVSRKVEEHDDAAEDEFLELEKALDDGELRSHVETGGCNPSFWSLSVRGECGG